MLKRVQYAVNVATEKATKTAMETAMKIAQTQTADMMIRFTTDLQKMSGEMEARMKLKDDFRPVLVVEVDGIERKLSKPASPYLGRVLTLAKLGLNSLLVGPAGVGKTVVAGQVAEALELEFGTVCFTAGASESWIFGRQTANGFVNGVFSKLYKEGGVFLADEMDAADPNVLLAMNTALANGKLYNPINGELIEKHENFVFIGGANTVGKGANHVYTGRNRLDGATLNRFVIVMVDYVPQIEEVLCPNEKIRVRLQSARTKLRSLNCDEIISSRNMEQIYLQVSAGVEEDEAVESLTAGWSPEVIRQCGLQKAGV